MHSVGEVLLVFSDGPAPGLPLGEVTLSKQQVVAAGGQHVVDLEADPDGVRVVAEVADEPVGRDGELASVGTLFAAAARAGGSTRAWRRGLRGSLVQLHCDFSRHLVACFEVYDEKGPGFLDPVYQECLGIERELRDSVWRQATADADVQRTGTQTQEQ